MKQKQTHKQPHSWRKAEETRLQWGSALLFGTARREKLLFCVPSYGNAQTLVPAGRLHLRYRRRNGMQVRSRFAYPDLRTLVYHAQGEQMFSLYLGARCLARGLSVMDDGFNLYGSVAPPAAQQGFCLRAQVFTDGTVAHSEKRILIKRAKQVTVLVTLVPYGQNDKEEAYRSCKDILQAVRHDCVRTAQRAE